MLNNGDIKEQSPADEVSRGLSVEQFLACESREEEEWPKTIMGMPLISADDPVVNKDMVINAFFSQGSHNATKSF